MIRKMLWHTMIAALVVAGLGLAHQTLGSGAGLAALAGYTSAANSNRDDDD